MSLDPLQKLWQSRQLDIPVDQILKQAKAKQQRMFWFMASDLLAWLMVVVGACWQIHTKGNIESFVLGLFFIIFVSVMVGYVLWIRTSTWGIDSLDVRNTLTLSIRRAEAGLQMGRFSSISSIAMVFSLGLFDFFFPETFAAERLFVYGWTLGWAALFLVGCHWYGKRQRQKISHYQTLLSQLDAA